MSLVRINCRRACAAAAALVAVSVWATAPAVASGGGTRLALGGAVHGSVTSAVVVCNAPVARAQHKFFFDVKGRAGGVVLFSGTVERYSSPKTYNVSARYGHIILSVNGRIYTGITRGTIAVGTGARSASVNISLKNPVTGMPPGTATVKGHFSCTATTRA